MKLVIIEWVDSAFAQGWMDKCVAKTHKVSNCTSVGVLIQQDSEKITIVQSISDKDSVGDGITIPKVCIKRIRKLGVKR